MTKERSFTAWGYLTSAEAEAAEAYEKASGDVCACGHARREHFTDVRGCNHVYTSPPPAWSRFPCDCGAFSWPLSATESAEIGSGRGLDAELPREDTA